MRLALLGIVLWAANLQVYSGRPSVSMSAVREGVADPRGFVISFVDSETGEPVRYDPCSPIHYVVNPALAPAGGVDDVHTAVSMTAEASGLRFVYDGETDEVPSSNRASYQPERYGERWAPVLIGWAPGLSTAQPAGTGMRPLGLGGSSFERNDAGQVVYVSGQAVFDSTAGLRSGFAGETWGQVILHELGHIVGLDHVADPQSVMNPTHGLRPAAWGPGDRRGLWEVGLGSGCLASPPPP